MANRQKRKEKKKNIYLTLTPTAIELLRTRAEDLKTSVSEVIEHYAYTFQNRLRSLQKLDLSVTPLRFEGEQIFENELELAKVKEGQLADWITQQGDFKIISVSDFERLVNLAQFKPEVTDAIAELSHALKQFQIDQSKPNLIALLKVANRHVILFEQAARKF